MDYDSFLLLAQETTKEPIWWKSGYAAFGALVLATLIAYAFGWVVAKSVRSSDYLWQSGLIVWCLLVSALMIAYNYPPKLGVDLRGGVTYIAQLKPPEKGEEVNISEVITKLKRRIDPAGTKEIVLRQLGGDMIEIVIPDVDQNEADRIWQRIKRAGYLQFRIVADGQFGDHVQAIQAARTQLGVKQEVLGTDTDEDGNEVEATLAYWVNIGRATDDEVTTGEKDATNLPYKFIPNTGHLVRDAVTKRLVDMTQYPYFRSEDAIERGRDFAKWAKEQGYDKLQILMMNDIYDVEGQHLLSQYESFDGLGRPRVSFNLKPRGSALFGGLTSANSPEPDWPRNKRKLLGIVLDGELLSAPTINSTITTNGVIEGSFTSKEVQDYVAILKAGKLKSALYERPVSKDQISSTLGEEMQQKGLFAIGISFIAVLVFMICYYRFAGIVACMALIANLIFIVALIMSIKFPFSLTGLAGLVLTVGMSVDANVLIFERIREELEKGATLRMAIRNGFSKATTTIVDANLTTLITAVILYVIGNELIKGFAVALILGILMSMFTAIFCSRVVFDIAEKKRWISKLNMTRMVGKTSFDFVNLRTMAAFLSIAIILVGVVGMFARGRGMLGQDLSGGTQARIVTADQMDRDTIKGALTTLAEENGNSYEIEVTKITSSGSFEDGTVWRINTSMPYETEAAEGEVGSESALRSLISDGLKGKLAMRGLKAGGVSSAKVETDPAKGTSSEPDSNPKPAEVESTPGPITETDPAGNGCTQDDPPLTQEEPSTSETETPESETDGDSGSVETLPNVEDEDVEDEDDSFDPNDRFEHSVDLEFNFEVSAASVINDLTEIAEDNDIILELGFDDLKAANPTTGEKYFADKEGSDQQFSAKQWSIKFKTNTEDQGKTLISTYEKWLADQPFFQSVSGVGSAIAGENNFTAIAAIIFSLIGIIAYIWVRFQQIAFGLAAVVALVHDVLVVLGTIALSAWLQIIPGMDEFKITLTVIAAFLTIIGYSLNDTIVVFDRIREVRGKNPDLTKEMINKSIGQTLSRTVLTSLTTFIVVFILFVIGGDSIHGFAFALVVGVIVGTYSSIFVASPVLLWLLGREKKYALETPAGNEK